MRPKGPIQIISNFNSNLTETHFCFGKAIEREVRHGSLCDHVRGGFHRMVKNIQAANGPNHQHHSHRDRSYIHILFKNIFEHTVNMNIFFTVLIPLNNFFLNFFFIYLIFLIIK